MPDTVRRPPVLDRAVKVGPASQKGAGAQVGNLASFRFDAVPRVLPANYGGSDLGDVLETTLGGSGADRREVTIPFQPDLAPGWGVETDDGLGFLVDTWSELGRRHWQRMEIEAR